MSANHSAGMLPLPNVIDWDDGPLAPLAPAIAGLSVAIRRHRAAIIFLHDAIMVCLSFAIASALRLGGEVLAADYQPTLLVATLIFAAIALPILYFFGVHRQAWRYASLTDLVVVINAVTLAVLIFMLVMFVITRLDQVPRSVPIIQWGVLVILLGGPRMIDRWLRACWASWSLGESRFRSIPVLVLGTGEEAQLFLRAIAAGSVPLYRAVGVLELSDEMVGRSIQGVPVLGRVDDLPAVLARLSRRSLRPRRLIMTNAAERLSGKAKMELFERAPQLGLTLARLPRITDFKRASERPAEVQPIALEDLLGRPEVNLDQAAIAELIAGRRILITGAGGSIGSELTRQIATLRPSALILLEHNEYNLYNIELEMVERFPDVETSPLLCDIRSAERVSQVFGRTRPDVVFHAAALKHVPIVEANPLEGVLTNTLGTRNVADAACAHQAMAMVLISTDKAVNPTSVMGASKRLAEYYCQALDLTTRRPGRSGTRFLTVRFGNVLGSSGSVVPLFQRQLAKGGPLTVTHPEIRRYFMTIPEAVGLILQASTHGLAKPEDRGRIFVLDMGEPIKVIDIAIQVVRLAGLEPGRDIKIKITGLRPGEKLYEELFDSSETPVETGAAGVLAAMAKSIELGRLKGALDRLQLAVIHQDVAVVEEVFDELIGGFRESELTTHDGLMQVPMIRPRLMLARRIKTGSS